MAASSPSHELSTEIYVIRAGRRTIYLRFLEICSKRRRAFTCEVASGRWCFADADQCIHGSRARRCMHLRGVALLPAAVLLASPWKFKQSGKSGLWISDLFPNIQKQADQLCLLRGMKAEI
ncbi:MAG: DUF1501 domain-containing protein, partial [Planctomycetota bacterium]